MRGGDRNPAKRNISRPLWDRRRSHSLKSRHLKSSVGYSRLRLFVLLHKHRLAISFMRFIGLKRIWREAGADRCSDTHRDSGLVVAWAYQALVRTFSRRPPLLQPGRLQGLPGDIMRYHTRAERVSAPSKRNYPRSYKMSSSAANNQGDSDSAHESRRFSQ